MPRVPWGNGCSSAAGCALKLLCVHGRQGLCCEWERDIRMSQSARVQVQEHDPRRLHLRRLLCRRVLGHAWERRGGWGPAEKNARTPCTWRRCRFARAVLRCVTVCCARLLAQESICSMSRACSRSWYWACFTVASRATLGSERKHTETVCVRARARFYWSWVTCDTAASVRGA